MAEAADEMSEISPFGSDTKRLFGLVLIVVGVLWLVTTGLCTLGFLFFITSTYHLMTGDLLWIVGVGGPSALIGWGIYATGRWLRLRQS